MIRRAEPRFDETIHAPVRLRVCALTLSVDRIAYAVLRDELGVADSVLSKHLKTLQEAGYVVLEKSPGPSGRRSTWVQLTSDGRRAVLGHLAALRQLADAADGPDASTAPKGMTS